MSQEEKHTTTWNGLLTFLRAGDTPATTGGWKKKKRGRPSRLRGRKNNGPGPERGGPPRPCRPGCVCGCLLLQRHSGTVTNVYLGLSCHHYLLALVHLRHLSTTQCPFCVDVSAPALPLLRVSHHHCPVSGVPEAQKEFATRKKKKKKQRRVADASLFLPPVHRRRLPRCPSCCCPSPFLGLSPQKGSSGARPARTYASWDGRWGVTPEREEGQGGNMKRKKAL